MILKSAPPNVNPSGFTDAFLVLGKIPFRTKVYMTVLGPGNVRWGTNITELQQGSPVPGVNMGIPQNAAAGTIEREWIGDIYAISDTPNTPVQVVCPAMDHNTRTGGIVA